MALAGSVGRSSLASDCLRNARGGHRDPHCAGDPRRPPPGHLVQHARASRSHRGRSSARMLPEWNDARAFQARANLVDRPRAPPRSLAPSSGQPRRLAGSGHLSCDGSRIRGHHLRDTWFTYLRTGAYLGKISYGLYVFHAAALRVVPSPLLALPLTIGIAALSYRYLESPFLRLKDRFARL